MKHAFLILAHTNYPLVGRLLKKLDSEDNNIYIHIDAKSDFSDADTEFFKNCCTRSKIVFADRYNVTWGGYSQVNAEMRIFELAARDNNDYYHIISGVDFPTKPMNEIHAFFEKNNGKEFVEFFSDEFMPQVTHRYSYYYWLQEKCGRNRSALYYLNKILAKAQEYLRFDRTKKYNNVKFCGGSNWVSVTHNFVTYLLSKEAEIKKMFSHSICCDEVFLQTILVNSEFSESVYPSNLRSVDWERGDKKLGSPYTYTANDYDELVNSDNFFCRKVTDSTPEGAALIDKLEQL